MRLFYSARFRNSYKEAPSPIRRAFDKQAAFLSRYPQDQSKDGSLPLPVQGRIKDVIVRYL